MTKNVLLLAILTLIGGTLSTKQVFASESHEHQCVQDICGENISDILSSNGHGPLQKIIPRNIEDYFERDLKPLLNKSLEADIQSTKSILKKWESVLEEENPQGLLGSLKSKIWSAQISEEEKIFKNSLYTVAIITKHSEELMKLIQMNESGDSFLRAEDLHKLEPQFSAKKAKKISQLINVKTNSGATALRNTLDGRTLEFTLNYLSTYFATKNLSELQDVLLSLFKEVEHIKGLHLGPKAQKLLSKESDLAKLSELEGKIFINSIRDILQIYSFVEDKEFRETALSFSVSNNDINKILKNNILEIKKNLRSNTLNNHKNEMLNICKEKINSSLASAPSSFALRRFKKLNSNVLNSVFAILPNYFPKEKDQDYLKRVLEALKNTTFTYPTSRDAILLQSKEHIESQVDSSLNKTQPEDLSSLYLSLIKLIIEDTPIQKTFSRTSRLCNEYEPNPMIDMVLPSEFPNVSVGWRSIKWPKYGLGILAHELGHIVYNYTLPEHLNGDIFYPFFDTIIQQRNQHTKIYGSKAINDGRHDDEDFADNFAISALKHLQISSDFNTNNFTCLFLRTSEKTKSFIYKDSMNYNMDLKQDSEGGHSSDFYRMLQTEMGLYGQFPRSCQKIPELQTWLQE